MIDLNGNYTLRDTFVDTFVSINKLYKDYILPQSVVDINNALQTKVSFYKTAAGNTKVYKRTKRRYVYERQDKPWWDNLCDILKYRKYNALTKSVSQAQGRICKFTETKKKF